MISSASPKTAQQSIAREKAELMPLQCEEKQMLKKQNPSMSPYLSRQTSSPEVSVVMPCMNESETLGTCIQKARRSLARHGISGEIVVADNGSTDGSPEIARALEARVVHIPTPGYGAALMGGIQAAQSDFIIMGDSDDSYDFSRLLPFIAKLRSGCDLVMGNRFQGGIMTGAMPALHRWFGNPVFSLMGRGLFGCPVGDIYCGLRGFTRNAYAKMGLQATGMEFATEMVIKSSLLGLKIAEVPIVLHPDGRSRRPHLRTWQDGWRTIRLMLDLARNGATPSPRVNKPLTHQGHETERRSETVEMVA